MSNVTATTHVRGVPRDELVAAVVSRAEKEGWKRLSEPARREPEVFSSWEQTCVADHSWMSGSQVRRTAADAERIDDGPAAARHAEQDAALRAEQLEGPTAFATDRARSRELSPDEGA